MACSTCHDFTSSRIIRNITIAALDTSAITGCPSCSLIKQCLQGMFDDEDITTVTIDNLPSPRGPKNLVRVRLRPNYRPKDPRVGASFDLEEEVLQLFILPGQEAPGDWVQTFRPVPEDPDSQESFTFVLNCLQRCLTEHSELCGDLPEKPVLPSRVVEIVHATTSLFRITQYEEKLGPYVALSYCWGQGVPVKLTSSTSTKLSQTTELQALPETLRDAIKLTERLGYRYIWIDSLCIYQDSKTDWEIESRKMGDIYQNAILTIAASSSKSCDISFLSSRPRLKSPMLDVVYTHGLNQKSYDLKVLRPLQYHESDDPQAGPLHQRAWCFQENILSRRIISYNNDEITFTCRSGSICQCQQVSEKPSHHSNALFRPQSITKGELLNNWFKIIFKYSRRELTFHTDRLAALSGIVSAFQRATGWTYVVGLWSEKVLETLCWYKSAPASTITNAATLDIAPTFSWASVYGDVNYNPLLQVLEGPYLAHTAFIRFDFAVAGQNPFDRVAPGAFIELEGPLLEVRLICTLDDTTRLVAAYHNPIAWQFTADAPLKTVQLGDRLVAARSNGAWTDLISENVTIWILFLATSSSDAPFHADALVLRKLQGNGEVFERIGLLVQNEVGILNDLGGRQAHEICSVWLKDATRTRLKIY